MFLQVIASSGHFNVRSIWRICFNDFQTRFLFCDFGLFDKERTLKTGCGSSIFVELLRLVCFGFFCQQICLAYVSACVFSWNLIYSLGNRLVVITQFSLFRIIVKNDSCQKIQNVKCAVKILKLSESDSCQISESCQKFSKCQK